jgi:hypothetical protein
MRGLFHLPVGVHVRVACAAHGHRHLGYCPGDSGVHPTTPASAALRTSRGRCGGAFPFSPKGPGIAPGVVSQVIQSGSPTLSFLLPWSLAVPRFGRTGQQTESMSADPRTSLPPLRLHTSVAVSTGDSASDLCGAVDAAHCRTAVWRESSHHEAHWPQRHGGGRGVGSRRGASCRRARAWRPSRR